MPALPAGSVESNSAGASRTARELNLNSPHPPPSPLVVFCALFKEILCLPPPPLPREMLFKPEGPVLRTEWGADYPVAPAARGPSPPWGGVGPPAVSGASGFPAPARGALLPRRCRPVRVVGWGGQPDRTGVASAAPVPPGCPVFLPQSPSAPACGIPYLCGPRASCSTPWRNSAVRPPPPPWAVGWER